MLTVLNDPAARRSDSIRFGPSAYGVERAEVYISTRGFDPHRHDTYGIGVTTAGVQIFPYRGSQRVCLPGQLHFDRAPSPRTPRETRVKLPLLTIRCTVIPRWLHPRLADDRGS